jgi:hypothetical protein
MGKTSFHDGSELAVDVGCKGVFRRRTLLPFCDGEAGEHFQGADILGDAIIDQPLGKIAKLNVCAQGGADDTALRLGK